MSCIEVKDAPSITDATMYTFSSYPGEGLYRVKCCSQDCIAVVCNNIVTVAMGAGKLIPARAPEQVLEAVVDDRLRITESSFLKAIAIAQTPALAVELCR